MTARRLTSDGQTAKREPKLYCLAVPDDGGILAIIWSALWRLAVTLIAATETISAVASLVLLTLTIVYTALKIVKEWDARKERLHPLRKPHDHEPA